VAGTDRAKTTHGLPAGVIRAWERREDESSHSTGQQTSPPTSACAFPVDEGGEKKWLDQGKSTKEVTWEKQARFQTECHKSCNLSRSKGSRGLITPRPIERKSRKTTRTRIEWGEKNQAAKNFRNGAKTRWKNEKTRRSPKRDQTQMTFMKAGDGKVSFGIRKNERKDVSAGDAII